jgi:branched-chain amino acid aminotransferase
MSVRDWAFDIDTAGVNMASVAVTFEFSGRRQVGRTDVATLGEASAALPSGSYTTLRTYDGTGVVRIDQHTRRLRESVEGRGAPLDPADVRAAAGEALRATRYPESRMRLTWAPPRLFVSIEEFAPADPALRRSGVRCMTVATRRDRPLAKDTRFLATAQAEYAALPAMIHEGLMVGEDGAILEGLSSNFFAVIAGALHTEEARALPGVTRSMVLEIARGLMPMGAGAARVDAIDAIDEAFITSVSREILPVIGIDGATFGDGKPGPLTRELIRRFDEAVAREAEKLA